MNTQAENTGIKYPYVKAPHMKTLIALILLLAITQAWAGIILINGKYIYTGQYGPDSCALSETVKQCSEHGMNFPVPDGYIPLTSEGGWNKELGISTAYGNINPVLHQVALHTCYSVIVNRAMNTFNPKYSDDEDYRAIQTGVDEISAVYPISPYLQQLNEINLLQVVEQISEDAIQIVHIAKQHNHLKNVDDVRVLVDYCGDKHKTFIRIN